MRIKASKLELALGGRVAQGETTLTGSGTHVEVATDRGEYTCDRLVIAAGAWLPRLAPELELPLTVERNGVST